MEDNGGTEPHERQKHLMGHSPTVGQRLKVFIMVTMLNMFTLDVPNGM